MSTFFVDLYHLYLLSRCGTLHFQFKTNYFFKSHNYFEGVMETIEYQNGEITILWKPKVCTHSGVCVRTLPNVYDPKARPWIRTAYATTQELIDQVAKCPSGALSIKKDEEK